MLLRRLALAAGRLADYEAFCSEMSAMTFHEWEAFFRHEPWGYNADWERAGMICAAVRNSNPFRGKQSKTAKASDFIPKVPKPVSKREAKSKRAEIMAREREKYAMAARHGAYKVYRADGTPAKPSALLEM